MLGAASVAAGIRIYGSVAAGIAAPPAGGDRLRIEHPTGFTDIESSLGLRADGRPTSRRTAVVRTARKIFDGTVFSRSATTAPPPAPTSGGQR